MGFRRYVAFVLMACLHAAGCSQPPQPQGRRVVPSYDDFTRRLLVLGADQNGDGRLDQWTYVDGNRTLRGEADTDADGRIDRWEYFDANGALTSVGSSSRNDGVEDTWTMTSGGGDLHIARSTRGDRVKDRHEYLQGATLVRVEEDTNSDGRIDKWDRYEGAVLREVAFDMTFSKGRPDRRVRYDAKGQFVMVEIDPEGDGTFVPAPGEPEPPRTTGAKS